ncbi:hypothetical protein SFRURICE_021094 [Spodoptera frugiperda]|nr:hypothetical protein SFRURICE_021094 [Spodoptera frugiperda]
MDSRLYESKLPNHKIFKDLKECMSENPSGKLRNLIELKDDVFYVWNTKENCLLSLNLKHLEEHGDETPYQLRSGVKQCLRCVSQCNRGYRGPILQSTKVYQPTDSVETHYRTTVRQWSKTLILRRWISRAVQLHGMHNDQNLTPVDFYMKFLRELAEYRNSSPKHSDEIKRIFSPRVNVIGIRKCSCPDYPQVACPRHIGSLSKAIAVGYPKEVSWDRVGRSGAFTLPLDIYTNKSKMASCKTYIAVST